MTTNDYTPSDGKLYYLADGSLGRDLRSEEKPAGGASITTYDYTPSNGWKIYRLLKHLRIKATDRNYTLPARVPDREPKIIDFSQSLKEGAYVIIRFGHWQPVKVVDFAAKHTMVIMPGGHGVKWYEDAQLEIWALLYRIERNQLERAA